MSLRVAVNARRRQEAGEWVEKPNYFDVVVYGTSGENVANRMHEGGPVAVAGRLDWREWETKDGRHAQAVRIVARHVQFLSGAEDQELLDLADQNTIATVAAERY